MRGGATDVHRDRNDAEAKICKHTQFEYHVLL